ncbi:MAG TPA: hypothetical protein VK337_15280 [Xanthobacteraceae bacterium]|nr:hypothetical protein [Xanthobacteraceae bacterium]
MRPASYSIPDDIRATFVRLLAYMGGLAAVAVAAASFFAAPADIIAALGSASAPRPAWSAVERPYPAFELLMPELAGGTYNYAIQRRAKDGARKDLLSFGEPADAGPQAGPYVMVEIYRPAVAGDRFLDASSEIAARIVDYAVTDDVKPDGQIDSKFGPVALVDFAVAPHGHERRCLGFARALNQPAMQIAGWYCSAGHEVVDRAMVACLLDRLTLVNGDAKLAEMFARAEVKRSFCGQRNPILAATPEREEHIAPEQASKLKAALRGRVPAH